MLYTDELGYYGTQLNQKRRCYVNAKRKDWQIVLLAVELKDKKDVWEGIMETEHL